MRTLVLAFGLGAVSLPIWAADAAGAAPAINPEEIIRKFAAKEAEFRDARNNYTYRQSVKLEEVDPPGFEAVWRYAACHAGDDASPGQIAQAAVCENGQ